MMNVLPENDDERGEILLATCLLDYFPNACAAVARHSAKSNDKHNPGQSPHWARDKSTDHRNKIARHLIDAGGFDKDGNRHSVALAWRGLALLEDELIAEGATPGRNAVGSPGNTARRLDEASAIAVKQAAKVALAELTAESQKLGLYNDGIPAESAYLASFGPNADIPSKSPKADRRVLTDAERKAWGIGDIEPATLRGIPDSFTDSHGNRITRRDATRHPMHAEALRDHDERLFGGEDRL